ncbi:Coiled-coil domain-containing protein 25 [Coemansia brasiliensis]|uniref:Coiled-coil domain-containing protein 25 n=1 Tax=Coemansia brasiliensis TaxID=2650707 RepID=A0A9W8I8Q4_9FUNG|nr:Coiled-coil domain-containing protein 25 [Coemansia brasiliensis]
MVLYFTSTVVNPPAVIYMGKDKFENEDLIKHGWPEDVWFHVDKLSSAHVYLRLNKSQAWDAIDENLLQDLAQLCKANSIEGNKKDNITIIYTPWSNLLKRGDMATGQVSFKNPQKVKRVYVATRENAIVNRLNKTKREEYPDLVALRLDRDKEEARIKRNEARKIAQEERRLQEERKKKKEESDYAKIFENARKDKNWKPSKVSEDIFGDSGSDEEDDDAGATRYDDDFSDLL